MIKIPADIRKYAGIFSHGFVISMAPEIAKGALVELLKAQELDITKATAWVQDNTSLWKILGPQQEMLKNLAGRAGNIDWLTADWVIEAIKGDLPEVASLFLGWKKANNWLKRQVEIVRKEVANKT